jgi:phosphate transport system substrate-binding protein
MTSPRMMPRIALIAALLFGGGNFAVAAEGILRVGGTGAVTAMLPQLFAAFESGEEVRFEVVPSLGTSGSLRALSDDVLDIAVSGRVLTEKERKLGLIEAVAIRTPYVLITSHPRPGNLNRGEIAGLFKSPQAKWADGAPVRIVLRPKSDSDTAVLGGMFPGMAAAIEEARIRPDVPMAATDQDNADLAERAPASLAGATLTQIQTERRNLRLVSIDGVSPSLEALADGRYPFEKTLYFILPARKNAQAERFITFLGTAAGQAALRAAGTLPLAD